MKLSIVIPAYEESKKIGNDIRAASEFLCKNNLSGEIIVVDDASTDGTAQAAGHIDPDRPKGAELKVIRYDVHRGKGYAVRTGIIQTTGDYVMFADSGCCVPYDDAMRGLDMIKAGLCDIAHGSRKMKGTHIIRKQRPYRHICSTLFHWFAIIVMGIPAELTDTQCGFKIYRGDVARHLYGQCETSGFMFDIEIILRALRDGYRIKEFPIDWACDRDSRLSPARSLRRILGELMRIKKTLRN
jgi:dolichyl-phosphate beta-glucosyltransferase